jgi:hypothetical protein
LGLAALAACNGVDVDAPPTALPGSGGFAGFPPLINTAGAGACDAAMQNRAPMRAFVSPKQLDLPLAQSDVPPPPISGGTLVVSADGTRLFAADPDRDQVYVVNVATRALERRIALRAGDEPGRLAEDAAGRVHVALRGGRGIATFDGRSPAEPRRTEVCDLPRGIAYDKQHDRLYVACGEGKLVLVDPKTGVPQLKVELGRDLRDVVWREDGLFVTRFRSAELLQLDAESGAVVFTQPPPPLIERPVEANLACPASNPGVLLWPPRVAWRLVDGPGRGVVELHQRALGSPVRTTRASYATSGACGFGVVRGSVTLRNATGALGEVSVDLHAGGLFVDVALDAAGSFLAVANAAGWGTPDSVMLFALPGVGASAINPDGSLSVVCVPPLRTFGADGQVTSVVFIGPQLLAAQLREPAGIAFYELQDPSLGPVVPVPTVLVNLDQASRNDSGHALFHATTGEGIACASCHPEAGDDGQTWTIAGIGPRRTQSLRGGLLATAPFQWSGDMPDFAAVVSEKFVKRMNGPVPDSERVEALARWLDKQPALRATPPDPEAVARGKALFESEDLGCHGCHDGDHFTNNQNKFVGTEAVLQVPSLVGVSFRAPFLHTGCARTLDERALCDGGDMHGHTAQLSSEQYKDLNAYLESL